VVADWCIRARPEASGVPELLWPYRLKGVMENAGSAIYGNRVIFLAADGYHYALE
jgi:hypothetical protein